MPAMSVLMRSSIALKRALSSSMASRSVPTGTRVSVLAGPGDAADRTNQPVDRRDHAPRDQHPARQPDEDDGHRDERDDGAEPREQFVSALGALADLEQRAVGEPGRGDLEPRRARVRLRLLPQAASSAEPADVEVAPLGRHAEEERLGAAADHANEEPFVPAGPLFDVDRPRERGQAASRIARGVLPQCRGRRSAGRVRPARTPSSV